MRTSTRLLFSLLAAFLLPLAVLANVIVKGTVKFPNGQPVTGYTVYVASDSISSPTSCNQTHVRYTNSNGFYQDTIICNATISQVRVWVANCDGTTISKLVQVSANGVAECNFVICTQPCVSRFTSVASDSIPLAIQFYMQISITAGDAIVKFKWNFGDGQVDSTSYMPLHVYAQRGLYNVCLTIKTASGCTNDFCKTINSDSAIDCRPEFNVQKIQGTVNRYLFNSSPSFVAPGDSIISRKWTFGDGVILNGNVVAPEYQYANPGNYNVCLTTKTRLGCEKTVCKVVQVTNNECRPEFTFEPAAGTINLVKFNSASSTFTPGDSIVSRYWTFGDSTTLAGNIIAPQHQYNSGGTYTVCLTTKTKFGCEKTVCKPIVIGQVSCRADFVHEVLPPTSVAGRVVKFKSHISTTGPQDSIVSRRWKFGDGTGLDGNVVDPSHLYLQPGTYTVCLVITSARGCKDSVCKPVIVPQTPTACHAEWTHEIVPASNTNSYSVRFHSQQSTTATGDSIVSRKWTFGDGTDLGGNVTDPLHVYPQPGTYIVCLYITSARGCKDSVCKPVVVPVISTTCHAAWTFEIVPPVVATGFTSVRFHSQQSNTAPGDSIVGRRWTFGDGTSLNGNITDPIHPYQQPGTYLVCLYITSARGCKDSLCKQVVVPPNTFRCQPKYSHFATGLSVNFNSAPTQLAPGDSVINRFWTFGDGTSAGNLAVVTHLFPRAGEYEVCLRIQTRSGCMETWCKKIAVVTIAGNCVPYFTAEQIAGAVRTMRFNSSASYSQLPGDSIVERNWTFGDGASLGGNVVNPTHQYNVRGSYTVCLKLKTRLGCETRWCREILVQGTDSSNTGEAVKIVNLYPVPVSTVLNATLWSKYNNVNSTLAIYDVYGVLKWSQNKLLTMGNSSHQIPVSQLANGPYIFRVTTIYGVISRNFFKVQ